MDDTCTRCGKPIEAGRLTCDECLDEIYGDHPHRDPRKPQCYMATADEICDAFLADMIRHNERIDAWTAQLTNTPLLDNDAKAEAAMHFEQRMRDAAVRLGELMKP